MFTIKKTPAWIKSFPVEIDREALLHLAKSSKGSFDKPREMNFVLYGFTTPESIENAIHKIEHEGWTCRTIEQGDDSGMTVIESQKKGYRITEDTYTHDRIFFTKIADLYGAGFDGWYASN